MRQPAPQVQPLLTHVSPNLADLVFFISVDHRIPGNENVNYGDPYKGQNASRYPDHILVYVGPEEIDKEGARWSKHYYAADRDNQDNYNWELDGDTLTRTYLIRRALYRQKAQGAGGLLPGEFTYPPGATPDSVYTNYGFADDEVIRSDTELDSLFVFIRRKFLIPTQTNVLYDETIEHNVSIVRQLIAKSATTGDSSPGIQVEREYGNFFHDWRVTSTVLLGDGEAYPISMTSLIVDVPYRFPQLMRGARMVAAWAIADSEEAAVSYDEAWYINWDLIDPAIGPYEARVRRFLTSNPNALRASYPIQKFVTKRETIGISRAWFHASNKGNSTYAEARQIEVPPSVHDNITIVNGASLSVGQSTNQLDATPNFSEVSGLSSMIVGYESKQARYGLYIVEIVEINCTGVYNGQTVPFGTTAYPGTTIPGMGAEVPPAAAGRPLAPSASISADNTTISGTTSPNAEVQVTVGSALVGRGVATNNGSFSLTLAEDYVDAVSLTLVAYLNGEASPSVTLSTNDRSPDRPSGYLSSDGTTLTGTTEPGATINILRNASAQVETATLPAFYPQVETLTFAGTIIANDTFPIAWVSALVSETVDVTAEIGDTMAQIAEKARALFAAGDTNEHWALSVSGDDLIFTARVVAGDDATAEATITDPNLTGITPATSADTVAGGTVPVAITTAGTVIVTVTSGIADWSPLNISVWGEVGDDPTDVMAKASAAAAASQVADDYTPNASTNNLSLTALVTAADDPLLNIAITEGTCEGLVPTPTTSTNTTPGGTVNTVVANGTGAYTYAFPAALSPGDLVAVTASDAGGTSAALILEASASPPTLATAIFADSDTITGTGTVGAKIIAYVGDADVGDTTVGGGGTFSLNTDYKLIRGEVVQVVAVVSGNEDVRSSPIFLTAGDLNLEVPVFEYTSEGYVGVKPAGATEIRIRKVLDSSETTATIQSNDNFIFVLPDAPAGTAFDVYARYATGDSDTVRVHTPYARTYTPFFSPTLGSVPAGYVAPPPIGWIEDSPYFYFMKIEQEGWVDGTEVTISFPGSDVDDLVFTSVPSTGGSYYLVDYLTQPYAIDTPPGVVYNHLGAVISSFRFHVPLDLSGPVPMPYAVVRAQFTYPDGQVVVATFDRATFANRYFRDGAWQTGIFTPGYTQQVQDYYDSLFP